MTEITISNKRLVSRDDTFNNYMVDINGTPVRAYEKKDGNGFALNMKDLCQTFGYETVDEFKASEEWTALCDKLNTNGSNLIGTGSHNTNSNIPVIPGFSSVAIWAGGTLDQAVNLAENPYRTDDVAKFLVTHSGLLVANDALIRGKIESNVDKNRIVIDPETRSLKMLYGDLVLFELDFFVNGNYAGARMKSNLYDLTTGELHSSTEMDGGKVSVSKGGSEFVRFDAYQSKIWVDVDRLSQDRDSAYPKEAYMDGEIMKFRRE